MPPLSTYKQLARLARWGFIATVVLMGAALFATAWSTDRGVKNASDTLLRGQSGVFYAGIRHRIAQLGRAPDDADLADILADYADDGLVYIGTLQGDEIVAEAGVPLGGASSVLASLARTETGLPEPIGGRVRVVFARRDRRARPGRPDAGPDRESARRFRSFGMVIEFEPKVASQLRETASRTLGFGAAAAGALLLVAIGLVRFAIRREELERQLEHERRLAALGQMSAVLAHEIRNPLASLKGNAQLLARVLPEGERSRAKADRIVGEAMRLESLTNDLLEFARAGDIRREPVDPAELLRDAASSVGGDRVEIDAAGAPTSFSLDPARIRQVLVNLIDNAVQASDETVTCSAVASGNNLIYVIRDRGPGVPDDEVDRIFEPFYTQKTRGTGLGLAVAKRLVELHGGAIEVDRAADGGAIFRVRIPED